MKSWNRMFLVVLLCLSASTALAAEVEGSASLGVYDKYLWRGIDLSGGTAVTQGSVDVTVNGLKLGVWANAQLEDAGDYDGGDVNEVDLTVEYSFDVGEELSISVGNVAYLLKDLPDTSEAYLGATVNTLLSPTFTLYWDWDQAEENGLYYTAAISHTFEPCNHTAINLGALVGYNDKSDYLVGGYSGWQDYELSTSVEFKVTENLTITPALLYSSPISDAAKQAIDSEWLGSLAIAYTF